MIAFFWMVTKQIATDKRGVSYLSSWLKLEARKLDIYVLYTSGNTLSFERC